ncbi:MAG: GNAT family N-acetyltransferase [Eubacteriales bacterium]|nr:GNAT family N-acetyltransferase [Eubacteriales bacterium]
MVELRQLTPQNGMAEYAMLQDMDAVENGFSNEVKGMSFQAYQQWLLLQDGYSRGENLPENFIPQTVYFLYIDGLPVGMARIRHRSSALLESQGVGNFGYGIAKSFRGKGYGNALFVQVLKKCSALGYTRIRSFVAVDNTASNRIFQNNGAIFLGVWNGTRNIYETPISPR